MYTQGLDESAIDVVYVVQQSVIAGPLPMYSDAMVLEDLLSEFNAHKLVRIPRLIQSLVNLVTVSPTNPEVKLRTFRNRTTAPVLLECTSVPCQLIESE